MPLSEHEQRMLDQIESALYAEDPKFASSVRGSRISRVPGKRRIFAGVGFIVGLVLLVTGLLLQAVQLQVAVGIVGFLLMFGSLVYLLWSGGTKGPVGAVRSDGTVGPKPGKKSSKGGDGRSFSKRMEDRFRHRFE
ncbi:DUF3040 domain-containing protein [Tsukamurella sp. 8F]|uniref:DUF3040 domain-containing protein n=1 Tax=unclassified Tsukamurella TaxID=2633480 RepID=UPI0023B9BCC5|nr:MULTISPECIES: DUF3040 domain-containing protein [unclassified Tsukamurella]MDF0532031.1 DUF3040 domain-containing protein [Tsukamurella sp. 8J]MDF0588436.1 DUF3040 domain-containing protein [Tsukamurella sp. 8F]